MKKAVFTGFIFFILVWLAEAQVGVCFGYYGSLDFDSSNFGLSFSFDSSKYGLSLSFEENIWGCSIDYFSNKYGPAKSWNENSIILGLTYGYPIFDFMKIYGGGGLGLTLFNEDESAFQKIMNSWGLVLLFSPWDVARFAWKVNGGLCFNLDGLLVKFDISYNTVLGTSYGIMLGLGSWDTVTPTYRPVPQPAPVVPQPAPVPVPPPPKPVPPPEPPRSRVNPTITSEQLVKIELAYAATVRDIENRGRRLFIPDRQARAAFIRQWQGNPDTAQANAIRSEIINFFSSERTTHLDIIALARKEPNIFRKVRLIHDWVADTFTYDMDLLAYIENISKRNKIFTLGELVELKRGVCFEYAIIFFFLMDAAGIETYLISDHSQPGIGHAYNMVVINGTGYIIDATWDSGNSYQNGRVTQFNKTVNKSYFMPGISQSYYLRGW